MCVGGPIPEYGPPTGGSPPNIPIPCCGTNWDPCWPKWPVWPNAEEGPYPVCDISKCIASIHLIEKRYICYLQYRSTGVADLAERSSRAWKLDTGTTTRPGTIRDYLHTAHGSPSCAVLNADGLESSTMHLPAQSGS